MLNIVKMKAPLTKYTFIQSIFLFFKKNILSIVFFCILTYSSFPLVRDVKNKFAFISVFGFFCSLKKNEHRPFEIKLVIEFSCKIFLEDTQTYYISPPPLSPIPY